MSGYNTIRSHEKTITQMHKTESDARRHAYYANRKPGCRAYVHQVRSPGHGQYKWYVDTIYSRY